MTGLIFGELTNNTYREIYEDDFKEIVSRLAGCLKDDGGLKRIEENSDYILENWTAAGLRLKHKRNVKNGRIKGVLLQWWGYA